MRDWQRIARHISQASGSPFVPDTVQELGGGCINRAVQLGDGRQSWFVKLNRASLFDMFEAEFEGLNEIDASNSIRVPRPLCVGTTGSEAYIVLEHLDLGPARNGQAKAGEQLAAMHRHHAGHYGWHRDNTIGATPQPNDWTAEWPTFWRLHRLGAQLELAARNGHGGHLQQLGEKLLEAVPALLDHAPQPSLIHGDLWGGNMAFDAQGEPVIFDPATYYGDREAEIAMTELFGGFESEFYAAYNATWPLDPGYPTRKQLYNLYHVLNHLNLFGSGYKPQAIGLMEGLLSTVH